MTTPNSTGSCFNLEHMIDDQVVKPVDVEALRGPSLDDLVEMKRVDDLKRKCARVAEACLGEKLNAETEVSSPTTAKVIELTGLDASSPVAPSDALPPERGTDEWFKALREERADNNPHAA